jgi:hypothetical protein
MKVLMLNRLSNYINLRFLISIQHCPGVLSLLLTDDFSSPASKTILLGFIRNECELITISSSSSSAATDQRVDRERMKELLSAYEKKRTEKQFNVIKNIIEDLEMLTKSH